MKKKTQQIKNRKVTVAQFILNLAIIGFIFLMIYPLAMGLWNAFKSADQYTYSQFYPTLPLRFNNIKVAFSAIWRYMLNTVIVAVISVAGAVAISTMAAYAFAKMDFPGRKPMFALVMGLMMIPGILTLIPSFSIYRDLGLLNSLWVLIIPNIVGGGVGNIFLLNAFFKGIPNDIFESARMDGANEFHCFSLIAVPLCVPIICTQVVMQLIGIWNDYMWPMITIQDYEKLTISPGLVLAFENLYSGNMPVQFAGYLVSAIPLILLFIFANKYYIRGIIGSSIKL